MTNVKRIGLVLLVCAALPALAGCGDGGASTDAGSTPASTPGEPAQTAPAADIRDTSAELCNTMRDTIGSLPSPDEGGDQEFEDAVLAAQEAYLDGMSALPVAADQKETLEHFLISQQALFDAQATARNSENPEESGIEGGAAQADATVESEKLAKELGIVGCAGV